MQLTCDDRLLHSPEKESWGSQNFALKSPLGIGFRQWAHTERADNARSKVTSNPTVEPKTPSFRYISSISFWI